MEALPANSSKPTSSKSRFFRSKKGWVLIGLIGFLIAAYLPDAWKEKYKGKTVAEWYQELARADCLGVTSEFDIEMFVGTQREDWQALAKKLVQKPTFPWGERMAELYGHLPPFLVKIVPPKMSSAFNRDVGWLSYSLAGIPNKQEAEKAFKVFTIQTSEEQTRITSYFNSKVAEKSAGSLHFKDLCNKYFKNQEAEQSATK